MGFNRDEVAALLVKCHRRCCICHRFCGTKIETDHIVPAAETHDDSIENAIPVCFDCHAEIHAYNPKHPRGRKFTPEELRMHKEQWLRICETRPEIFVEASRNVDVGPLQGMLDELEYNLAIYVELDYVRLGSLFRDEQLSKAIREGVISTLSGDLSQAIYLAYGAVSKANEAIHRYNNRQASDALDNKPGHIALESVQRAIPLITDAHDSLMKFVKSE